MLETDFENPDQGEWNRTVNELEILLEEYESDPATKLPEIHSLIATLRDLNPDRFEDKVEDLLSDIKDASLKHSINEYLENGKR